VQRGPHERGFTWGRGDLKVQLVRTLHPFPPPATNPRPGDPVCRPVEKRASVKASADCAGTGDHGAVVAADRSRRLPGRGSAPARARLRSAFQARRSKPSQQTGTSDGPDGSADGGACWSVPSAGETAVEVATRPARPTTARPRRARPRRLPRSHRPRQQSRDGSCRACHHLRRARRAISPPAADQSIPSPRAVSHSRSWA
jgi:hypothetical protein